ncbi:MAG: RhuM family protein [Candidatus Omnitrophota bacterium]
MKNKITEVPPKGKIAIYRTKDNKIRLEVKLEQETVWLSQEQIAKLFKTERSVITKHLGNIFRSNELDEKSNVHFLHIAFSDRPVKFYNLDIIISVGYRVNSTRATQFRIWATNVLKRHLIDGYTLNQQRLKQQTSKLQTLQRAVKLIASMKDRKQLEYQEAMGLLEVISDYNYALGLLDDYDYKRLKISKTSKEERGESGKPALLYC